MRRTQTINYRPLVGHLLFWVAFILYQAISYGWEDTDQLSFRLAPQIIWVIVPVTILLTYLNLYILMPVYYYRQRYVPYALSAIVLISAGGLIARLLTHEFIIPWERIHDPVRYRMENRNFWIPVRIFRLSIQLCPVIALAMLLKLMRNAFLQEKNLRKIEHEKFSVEMGFLKAQINPHFFFNTLNSLYALTLKGSDQASKIVLRLSGLMRYMLYDAGQDKVLLKDEINYLEDYLDIEKMRLAGRLDLSFQSSGEISGKMISPLLLLPFVENAFKHGVEENVGWITIDLKVTADHLFFKVENSFIAASPRDNTGLGLANVKRRLDLIYPGNHTLKIVQHDSIFEAILNLDL
jgi:two-component system LytT family sensor kinase